MEKFHIQWHITELCNLKCVHCYGEPWRKELNIEKLKLVINKIVDFVSELKYGEIVLTITGGEPFIKPEFYELISYIDRNERFDIIKRINIITNGTILPKVVIKEIKKLNMIYVSLESLQAEVNDKIRGKGSLNRVLRNLDFFIKDYNIGIMTTLMKDNIENLTNNIYQFIKKLFDFGAKEILFERFIPAGKAKLDKENISVEEVLTFYQKIAEVFELCYDELKKYPALKFVNSTDGVEIYGAECVVGKFGFAVLCDGAVYPCRRFEREIFNFLESNDYIDRFSNFIKSLEFFNKQESKNYYCFATENLKLLLKGVKL